jgi:hypothetical protein
MARDAIRAYIESLRKDHLPIPADRPPVKEEVRIRLPGLKPRDVLRPLPKTSRRLFRSWLCVPGAWSLLWAPVAPAVSPPAPAQPLREKQHLDHWIRSERELASLAARGIGVGPR